MKRILSLTIAVFLLLYAGGSFALPAAGIKSEAKLSGTRDGGLCLDPSELTIPVFSGEGGVRVRAYLNGVFQSAYNFTWSSSDPSAAEVDEIGNVYAVSPGTTVITASGLGGSASCTVTVVPDEGFPGVDSISFTEITAMPYYENKVGIGPMYGAEPVIIRRFLPSPSCSVRIDDPGECPDPEDGWAFTYAVGYHFRAEFDHDYLISVSKYSGEQDHDVDVFISIYDSYFNLTGYAYCSGIGEYPAIRFMQYYGGDYYVVLTPLYHPVPTGNGYVEFSLIDLDAEETPLPGDVDLDGAVNSIDALLVLRLSMDLLELSDEALLLAEVSGDAAVDSVDALLILRYALGLIDSFRQ